MVSVTMRCLRFLLTGGFLLLVLAACNGDDESVVADFAEPSGVIAFSTDRDGDGEIYVMEPDGNSQVNITDDPANDSDPWWSPDGTQIGFASSRSLQPDLFIMGANGSDVQRLTEDPAVDGAVRWSPDGSKVAFYSFDDLGKGFLWVSDPDGSNRMAVLEEIHPAAPEVRCAGGFPGGWFADGERILFRGSHAGTNALEICSVNADGSDIQVLYSEPSAFSIFPALSPDGQRIAFVSNRDDNEEIYLIDINGENLTRITDKEGVDTNPTWSPDGQWLAFASDRDGDFEIYIVRADGKGLRQLTDNDFGDGQPAWSPG